MTLKFTVDGLEEIQRWILGWTGDVKIVSPAELRVAIIERLRKGIDDNLK